MSEPTDPALVDAGPPPEVIDLRVAEAADESAAEQGPEAVGGVDGPAVEDSGAAEAPVTEAEDEQSPEPAERADGPAAADEEPLGLDLDALPSGAAGAIEAVLMVIDEPVQEATLATALALPLPRVRELLAELAVGYDETGRGFELRRVAGGWRIYSRPEYAPVVERFMLDGQTAKLTQAALETLAIVAYRQPVSRARVGAVRGVNVDAVMRTLSSRGLVEDAGNDPETGAVLYRTTPYFLQRIGLSSLDELPALAPYLPEADVLDELAGSAS